MKERISDPKKLKTVYPSYELPQYHIVYRNINSFSSEGASNTVFTSDDIKIVLDRLNSLKNNNKNPNMTYDILNDYGDIIPEQLLKKQL